MSAAEYDDWKHADLLARRRAGLAAPSICSDCPLAFRQAALVAGVCNGAKRVVRNPRNTPDRLQTWREYKARSRAGIRMRRTPAEVAALQHDCVRMRAEGISWAAIARRYGIDSKYAYDLVKRAAA